MTTTTAPAHQRLIDYIERAADGDRDNFRSRRVTLTSPANVHGIAERVTRIEYTVLALKEIDKDRARGIDLIGHWLRATAARNPHIEREQWDTDQRRMSALAAAWSVEMPPSEAREVVLGRHATRDAAFDLRGYAADLRATITADRQALTDLALDPAATHTFITLSTKVATDSLTLHLTHAFLSDPDHAIVTLREWLAHPRPSQFGDQRLMSTPPEGPTQEREHLAALAFIAGAGAMLTDDNCAYLLGADR